jgi:threonine/homoserine/homoserine lactone efflux protein
VIQAPHPEAIQTVSAQNGGFKKGFLVGISNPKDIIFFRLFSTICLYYPHSI